MREKTTVKPEVRVRLWDRLQQIVPQHAIPLALQPGQLQPGPSQPANSSVVGQEMQRKGPPCAVPKSKEERKMSEGFFGMMPATFYVDSFGNVVSPAAVKDTLTYATVDHVFPYARGGLSKQPGSCIEVPELSDSNFMLIQNISNQLKGSVFQQEYVR